jgi:CBS domain-containing protein
MMRDRRVPMLPVIDTVRSKRLLGVITDHDIVIRCVSRGHDGSRCCVKDHMTGEALVSVGMDADVREVAAKMEEAKLRRIPVLAGDGRLVGVIALADLARRLPEEESTLAQAVQQRLMNVGA